MASVLCSAPITSFNATPKPGKCMSNDNNQKHAQYDVFQNSPAAKFGKLKAKAAKSNQSGKSKSIICADCDGNGAIQCSQCKGSGVNSVDIFNGQFKAGDSCWLCGGKKEMLCGNCNGAGFLGGFMSTFDE
ncbi:protein BUNDLE SHEATH DEFECTIVE 2, chloroplastic-like [Quercus lobata]|uniref:BSD2 cysteine rich domain-containing protein n=1 Tax=Quercus lobata TaxID=97700 RepID=A0A7N2KU34_QUELO|nr:protein BUNDLE SHEATH DEFECTIVE 2, chloroplastic-like [Quercus lobata]